MKIGDAVKFIGFKEYRKPYSYIDVGIIVEEYSWEILGEKRYDVMWPNGKIGLGLFEETLEVISESR